MFRFKLKGIKVNPKSVPLNDLIEVSKALQSAITPLMSSEKPNADNLKSISIVDVREGSSDYAIHTASAEVNNAWEALFSAMKEDDYNDLPSQSISHLKRLNEFIEKKSYTALEFAEHDNYKQGSIEISKQHLLKLPQEEVLECLTSIYGKLLRVGGSKPTIVISLPNAQTLTCTVSSELACSISANLYKDIGLEGVAYWKIPGWELKEFSVLKANIYDHSQDLRSTINEIKEIVDGEYDEVDDIEGFIRKLRGK